MSKKKRVENISETEARTIKNESRKGASGRWIWMDDVGKGGGGGGGGDVTLMAIFFLAAPSLRCRGACIRQDLAGQSAVVNAANGSFSDELCELDMTRACKKIRLCLFLVSRSSCTF